MDTKSQKSSTTTIDEAGEEEEEDYLPTTIFEMYDHRFIGIQIADLEVLKHIP